MIFVLVVPSAADSRILEAISVLLLYFILLKVSRLSGVYKKSEGNV
jgi:hypothetical protein